MQISNQRRKGGATADERQVHTRDRGKYVSYSPYNTRRVKKATSKRMRREDRAELRNPRNW